MKNLLEKYKYLDNWIKIIIKLYLEIHKFHKKIIISIYFFVNRKKS